MVHPADIAFRCIEDTMHAGSTKDGKSDSWRHKPYGHHIGKAQRHLETYRLIKEGHIPDDGENHLKLALTRLAFILAQE